MIGKKPTIEPATNRTMTEFVERKPNDVFGDWSLVIDPSTFREVRHFNGKGEMTHIRVICESTISYEGQMYIKCLITQKRPEDENGVAPYRIEKADHGTLDRMMAHVNELRELRVKDNHPWRYYYLDQKHLLIIQMIYQDYF